MKMMNNLDKACKELRCDDCPLNGDINLCRFARSKGDDVPLVKILIDYVNCHKESLNQAESLIYPNVNMFYGPQDYYDADRRNLKEESEHDVHKIPDQT